MFSFNLKDEPEKPNVPSGGARLPGEWLPIGKRRGRRSRRRGGVSLVRRRRRSVRRTARAAAAQSQRQPADAADTPPCMSHQSPNLGSVY